MEEKNNETILSIRGMSKSFGRNRVLQHINLDVKRGTVMGLMGENGAGKSTMMKCLFGTYQKDDGVVVLDGKEVNFSGPKDALENGIAMVHQELNQCLERSVVDNLFLGRCPVNSLGIVDEARMRKEASELFRKLGMTINLTQPMGKMSVSQRQMCEIAKAISYNSKVIVLDEPTSSLNVQEVNKLFEMMRMLKEKGIALIYISHKMDEIFEICDEISVLRDGNLVMTKPSAETNMNELITAMVGRVLENRFPPVDNIPGDTVLSIKNLSTKFKPQLQDISFDVKRGEIFGLYGLVGAGRTELLETIFGVRTRASGRVYFKNILMNFNSPIEAMESGFAMITEERKANGLFIKGDLTFNTTIANLSQYKSGAVLSDQKMVKATSKEIKTMSTKCMGPSDLISSLSGGNQQKVIFGKWLERQPQVFMMDEPTRGIDVGAKYEIYELIIKMAKEGKTIIVVSSEMPEILGITNRIGVMSNGRLSGKVNTKETNQEELLTRHEKINHHPIEKEITQSYIDYAMSVIVARALPDTRDGFKPVLRRILYGMYENNNFYNQKHKKSARIVGDVMGKYHPHGDSSIYEAMVRLAQPWSMRYPLVDGQGNFGSIDGDGAAAMRYTEARLTKIAEEMLADLEQDTVDWRDNFDGSLKEPVMLATKFPNHLCNGTMGIAVGMATNMAPHNLNEVLDASLLLLQKEGKSDIIAYDESGAEIRKPYSVSIEEIMQIIKGPDFPTGGIIFDSNNILEVYKKGK